jgi:hypothetical protein
MKKKSLFLGMLAMGLTLGMTVTGCGDKRSVTVNMANIAEKLAALPGTAPDSPATVKLAPDNIRSTAWKRVLTAVSQAQQYVILDLSACSATDNTITGALGRKEPSDTDMNLIRGNQYVKGVIQPKSLTRIGNGAFAGCKSLTSVTISGSVTSIGESAFSGCSSLAGVTIPGGVTVIGKLAFADCKSLTSVSIPAGVTNIGESTFNGCASLTSVVIPEGVTSIGENAFSGCGSLTSVTIPDGVTSIGFTAFYNCSSLTGVVIPGSVVGIGRSAFNGCASLTGVTIADGVTGIGVFAFRNCDSLTELVIPGSVTSIGENAFEGLPTWRALPSVSAAPLFPRTSAPVHSGETSERRTAPGRKETTCGTAIPGQSSNANEE